jgi:hypothetical protein
MISVNCDETFPDTQALRNNRYLVQGRQVSDLLQTQYERVVKFRDSAWRVKRHIPTATRLILEPQSEERE